MAGLLAFEFMPGAGTALVLVGAALCGIGSALMWVAQGVVISEWSAHDEANRGRFVSIFWAGYQFSAVAGPFAAFYIIAVPTDAAKWFFGTFTVVSLCSTAVFLTLKCAACKLPPRKGRSQSSFLMNQAQNKTLTCFQRSMHHLKHSCQLLVTRNAGLLSLASFFGGNLLW